MSVDNIAFATTGTTKSTGTPASTTLSAEDRQKIQTLAAEFESLLTVNMLRDMRESAKWDDEGADTGGLGAGTFQQTFDTELSRYLSMSRGFGLAEQLMKALDRSTTATPASTPAAAASDDTTGDVAVTGTPAYDGAPWASPMNVVTTSSTTTAASVSGRTGWNGLKLDAPAYGGSGAQWAGFNNDRAIVGGDDESVKDGFFRWTYGLNFNPAGKSKDEIANFLRSNIDSAREYGLNILDVNEEKILVETAERGAEWVDVVASAGSPNPGEVRWQWLCQTDFGEFGGGAIGSALADLRSSSNGQAIAQAVLGEGTSGSALLARLQSEVSAARAGRASSALQAASAREAAASARETSTTATESVSRASESSRTTRTAAASTASRAAETSRVVESTRATEASRAIETVLASDDAATTDLRMPTGKVTSAYGWRRDPFTQATTFHRGVDVRAAAGDEVASAGAGRVVFSGTDGGYGRTVVVEHADGRSTRYAHLSSILVDEGDEVTDGQTVGLVGQSGRATAPHLHFEVIEDGKHVDPRKSI